MHRRCNAKILLSCTCLWHGWYFN